MFSIYLTPPLPFLRRQRVEGWQATPPLALLLCTNLNQSSAQTSVCFDRLINTQLSNETGTNDQNKLANCLLRKYLIFSRSRTMCQQIFKRIFQGKRGHFTKASRENLREVQSIFFSLVCNSTNLFPPRM